MIFLWQSAWEKERERKKERERGRKIERHRKIKETMGKRWRASERKISVALFKNGMKWEKEKERKDREREREKYVLAIFVQSVNQLRIEKKTWKS